MLSQGWRCSWNSADRRCSNYIWVINTFIPHKGAAYIRYLMVFIICSHPVFPSRNNRFTRSPTKRFMCQKIYLCHWVLSDYAYDIVPPHILTHWGRDKIAAVSQTTLSNAFSWMKMLEFRLRFHWSLFLSVQLTIFQHWFRYWLGAGKATSHYLKQWWLNYRRIYASLGLNEF